MPSTPVSIYDLNANFTGRTTPGFPGGYDPTRLYRLHRRNRAEVWSRENRAMLLDSIRRRRYIPAIIVHEVVEGGRVHHDILDGGNRISAIRRILEGNEFDLTEEDRRSVERAAIDVVILRNMNPEEIRMQFRLLNKVVRVSHGQLYHMSAEDSPLVAYAASIMTDETNALRPRILDIFPQGVLTDTASRGMLANLVALCAGAQNGERHITTSFDRNEPVLSLPINLALIETRLGLAFSAIRRANTRMPADWVRDGRVSRGEFNVGRYLGAILYDLLPHGLPGTASYEPAPADTDAIQDKWARIIELARLRDPGAGLATTVTGAGNLTTRKLRRLSKQVEFYLREGRMPNEQEYVTLLAFHGPAPPEEDDSDSEEDAA
jgi:hypothetical protein